MVRQTTRGTVRVGCVVIDPKVFRKNMPLVVKSCERRGFDFDAARYQNLEGLRKKLQTELESGKAQEKEFARRAAKMSPQEREAFIREHVYQDTEDHSLEEVLRELEALLAGVPNLVATDVPDGKDENANEEVRSWGVKRDFSSEPQSCYAYNVIGPRKRIPCDHVFVGKQMGMYDSAAAARMTGSRFSVLYGDLARLQRALSTFMLDVHTREHGYEEVYVPYIVNRKSLYGTGQLPKFEEDLFALDGNKDWFLIPTGEVALANLCRDQILNAKDLPKKWVSLTPCFRSEAGSYGKDTTGLIRQHQFEKVELVQVVHPDQSWQALEEMAKHAESILQKLELPYRVVNLCTGDLGFSAAKTYDIEVWMPSQDRYREISSCSNTLDFQARRLGIRYRDPATRKPSLVHILNASGLAVGRTLAAVIENCQEERVRVKIPKVLRPYMRDQEYIEAPAPRASK